MKPKPLKLAKNADLRLAPIAFKRAARAAQQLAERTGTYVVVLEKGKVVRKRPMKTTVKLGRTTPTQ